MQIAVITIFVVALVVYLGFCYKYRIKEQEPPDDDKGGWG